MNSNLFVSQTFCSCVSVTTTYDFVFTLCAYTYVKFYKYREDKQNSFPLNMIEMNKEQYMYINSGMQGNLFRVQLCRSNEFQNITRSGHR